MIHDWRLIKQGDYFTIPNDERLTESGDWRPVVYLITEIVGNTVHYRPIHDKTDLRTSSLGEVIDNGRDLF